MAGAFLLAGLLNELANIGCAFLGSPAIIPAVYYC